MSASNQPLKPQDVLGLLKLVIQENQKKAWNYQVLGQELGMSSSEVFQAVKRAKAARLMVPERPKEKPKIARRSFEEFLIHGVKYAFPASIGARRRGVPTAHSSAPLNRHILSSNNYVWAQANGSAQGDALQPLYPSVPEAAAQDPALHEILALVDAIRIGRSRERALAEEELHTRLAPA